VCCTVKRDVCKPKETLKRDLQKRPTDTCKRRFCVVLSRCALLRAVCVLHAPKETFINQKRPTKETYKRDPLIHVSADFALCFRAPRVEGCVCVFYALTKTYINQKRPTNETYKRDLCKRPEKETHIRILRKRPGTCGRDFACSICL